MTVSIENYLKLIYKQSRQPDSDTRLSTIARLLNISNAGATDMARKLATKKLVNYVKYKPLTLTSSGNKIALSVIRKHRLWESFLHNTLNLSLHEIHCAAEQLEHLTSDFLTEKINQYLGNPTIDPHGDPIPNDDGNYVTDDSQVLLSKAKEGNTYKISRLFSSEKDFFDFCSSNHIEIGSNIWVGKQYDSKKMTEVQINQNILLLNDLFTNLIFVKQVNSN